MTLHVKGGQTPQQTGRTLSGIVKGHRKRAGAREMYDEIHNHIIEKLNPLVDHRYCLCLSIRRFDPRERPLTFSLDDLYSSSIKRSSKSGGNPKKKRTKTYI